MTPVDRIHEYWQVIPAAPGWRVIFFEDGELRVGGSIVAWLVQADAHDGKPEAYPRPVTTFVCDPWGYLLPDGAVEDPRGIGGRWASIEEARKWAAGWKKKP